VRWRGTWCCGGVGGAMEGYMVCHGGKISKRPFLHLDR